MRTRGKDKEGSGVFMKGADDSPAVLFRRRFFSDRSALAGVVLILLMVGVAVFAPLLANEKPLMVIAATGEWSFPAFRGLFSTRSPEIFIELGFNYCLCCLPAFAVILLILRRKSRVWKSVGLLTVAAVLLTPFLFHSVKFDGTNWREEIPKIRQAGGFVLTAPIPYGPFETIGTPYEEPSKEHWLGVDHSGRDVAARMIYGARVSSAVGFLATGISLLIGTFLGLLAGYRGGKTDLAIMRLVEIVICFPTFLLLLILMSIMLDYDSRQSILLVILVIGFTGGWPGLCCLVRGETLKQRALPYISAAESMGVPTRRILFAHLLPNVSGPIFVTFTFNVAGAILAESSLSFLGFGVQDPAASWGELLRQAFPDPVTYWHLTLWPGLAIFLAVCAFNFVGEGLRKALSPK